ncbi:MAG TPA: beta-glucosidase BglX [Bacteroidales bacterium]|nr:beta-glucosidase BglX [Bacteroidales bacterium]
MKRISIAFFAAVLFASGMKAQDQKMTAFINDLMGKMTVEEKIGQLNLITGSDFTTGTATNSNMAQKIKSGQVGGLFNVFSVSAMKSAQDLAVKESPNHIPILFGMDVIHGYRTIFPIPLALSCTWDMQLIEKSARIAAQEATANGIAWTFSPMVDIARDARWGRIAEGSGEDPWLGSRIAEAMVKGYQGDDLTKNNTMMACVKHFALYGAAEAGRDYNTVDMSRLTMYNDYLPPYKAAVDAGAGSVMTSFNVVDGIPSTGNRWLLTELLRNEWGFNGFVVTDYTATNEMINHGMGDLQAVSALAVSAGTDMDMVGEGFLTTLKNSLDEGKISLQDIDVACRRVLEAKYKLGLFDDPYRYLNEERAKTEVLTPDNISTARTIASRSMVLLKNDKQVLPLKKSGTIAVIGPLGESKFDMLGTWAMGGDPKQIVSVVEGIKNVSGDAVKVLYAKGSELTDNALMLKATNPLGPRGDQNKEKKPSGNLLNEALQTAAKADVIVAVLGEASAWSGEASSMSEIGLQKTQQELLKALLGTGKPVVLVLINGRPLTLAWENENVSTILEAWAGGSEAGNAIADVLFGNYNPSGRLTTTFPRSVGQIPLYYNHKNTGRPMDANNKFTSKYLDIQNDPLYPFGYGLSYSKFDYSDIKLSSNALKGNDKLTVSVTVTNTSKLAGEEVVQLYIRDMVGSVSRPMKELKDFRKVMLQPGEKKEVVMEVTTDDLKFYNSQLKYDWEPGDFTVFVGGNSRDVKSAVFNWAK